MADELCVLWFDGLTSRLHDELCIGTREEVRLAVGGLRASAGRLRPGYRFMNHIDEVIVV